MNKFILLVQKLSFEARLLVSKIRNRFGFLLPGSVHYTCTAQPVETSLQITERVLLECYRRGMIATGPVRVNLVSASTPVGPAASGC